MRSPTVVDRLWAGVDKDVFDRDVRDQIQNRPRLAPGYGENMNPPARHGRESDNGLLISRVFVIIPLSWLIAPGRKARCWMEFVRWVRIGPKLAMLMRGRHMLLTTSITSM